MDNYYLGKHYVNKYLNGNFDTIKAIDTLLLKEQLLRLKQKQEINMPIYDFNTSSRIGFKKYLPSDVLIIEGIFVFFKPVIDFLDYKIYIDADIDKCYKRRLERDINERGRNKKDVDEKWEKVLDFYNHDLLVRKKLADYIVKN